MSLELNRIINGDALEVLKTFPDNCVDSIVTDPPYGIGFMGKSWDKTGVASNVEMWKECLRVLKSGGHLLSFGGTRTYHRMASAIEDAGFEVRDMVEWVYGSGFPKSLNIGKAVDKLQGNKREWIGVNPNKASEKAERASAGKSQSGRTTHPDITKGNSEWEGWGTALKPAHEPICMARKTLAEKTVAENVLKYGTGGINIDESRVGTEEDLTKRYSSSFQEGNSQFVSETATHSGNRMEIKAPESATLGRFPANLIHDNSEEVRECFPNESERFFKSILYQAKASKSERGVGNMHPTVKSLKLMEYLIKMVTPKGGVVLDPFAGSGSTLIAAKKNGFRYIGIELEKNYCEIAEKRIKSS